MNQKYGDHRWTNGKIALRLSQGGSGIGRALAKALAARGALVCVTDINAAAAEQVAAECGNRAKAVVLDVCDCSSSPHGHRKFCR